MLRSCAATALSDSTVRLASASFACRRAARARSLSDIRFAWSMASTARAANEPRSAMASWENRPTWRLAAKSTPITAPWRINGTPTIDTCRSARTEASTAGSWVNRSSAN
jgi:hypothetical protein